MPSIYKRRFSANEYYRMAEAGILPDRVELIDGRIIWGDTERRFNVVEFRQMIDAGILSSDERHELIDGEIMRAPVVEDYRERWIEDVQSDVLIDDFRQTLKTVIVRAGEPIRLSDHSELKPDIALLRPYANLYRGGHSHPDDAMLIVEVSRGAAEYVRDVKAPLYADVGVPELWVVNLEDDCIEGFSDPVWFVSRYRVKRRYKRGERIAPVALSRVSLDVESALVAKGQLLQSLADKARKPGSVFLTPKACSVRRD